MNYFVIKAVQYLSDGYVLLTLHHLYGQGAPVHIPLTGQVKDFPIGKRLEIMSEVVN